MKVVGVGLSLLLAGCGGGSDTPVCPPPLVGSCTTQTGICAEYSGQSIPSSVDPRFLCRDESDIWSTSGCSHAGTLGACRRTEGSKCVAVWVNASLVDTRNQAVSWCTVNGGTWIDP